MLRVRKAHPIWGSKKIFWTLDRERPDGGWPARRTVEEIRTRAGLVEPRSRRLRRQPSSPPKVEAAAPNDVWSMDYKGWFRVGDGTRCDPLTVNDVYSRASLVCQAMVRPKMADVRLKLEGAFRAFGMPRFMLSDGGPPFGANGLGRLSRLGVGILHGRSRTIVPLQESATHVPGCTVGRRVCRVPSGLAAGIGGAV